MKHVDLFSGIGGFSKGLEATGGFETVAFCEIEEYPRKVLKKHWPDVLIYEDVRDVTEERLRADGIGRIDIITGGFPCQDISVAGNQKGIEAERSGLWSECARLLGEIRPDYAIFENVTALLNGENGEWFQRVLWDISAVGYDAEWHCISASELGAHHHRDRIWIVAYPKSLQCNEQNVGPLERPQSNEKKPRGCGRGSFLADISSKRQQRQGQHVKPMFAEAIKKWKAIDAESGCISGIWEAEPTVRRMVNGVWDGIYEGRVVKSDATPKGQSAMRQHRLKGLGNSVCPQIPELLGKAILEIHRQARR